MKNIWENNKALLLTAQHKQLFSYISPTIQNARAEVCGGLNPNAFEKYLNNGMLEKVTDRTRRIKYYAYAPMWQIKIIHTVLQIKNKCRTIIKSILVR